MARRKIWIGSVGPYLFDDGSHDGIKADGDLIFNDDNAGQNTLSFLALGGAAGAIAAAAADDVSHVIILSGMPTDSENLGVFTGSTIPPSSTIREALQALETAIEAAGVSGIQGDGVSGRVVRMSRLRIQAGSVSGVHFTMSSKWNGDSLNIDNLAAGSSSGGFTYYADKYRIKIDAPIIAETVGVIASVASNVTGSAVVADAQVDGAGLLILLSRDDGSNIDIDVAVAAGEFSIDLFYVTTS